MRLGPRRPDGRAGDDILSKSRPARPRGEIGAGKRGPALNGRAISGIVVPPRAAIPEPASSTAVRALRGGAGLALCALLLAPSAAAAADSRGLDPAKDLGQYGLTTWTTDQGLPQSTVTAILASRQGYLWIGTYDGLARFDGLRFAVFHKGNTKGLGSNGVRALCEDDLGRIWVGTNGGGVSVLANGAFTRYALPGGAHDQLVWALAPDGHGGVWVGTNAGSVYRIRGGAAEAVLPPTAGEPVGALVQDRAGDLWVGSHAGGLKRLTASGEWRRYGTAEGLPTDSVSALLEDRAGVLWVGTIGGGLARRSGERFESARDNARLPNQIVWSLHEDARGTLWIATGGGGLARRTARGIDTFGPGHGLPDPVVYSVAADHEGSLWIGTNAGLVRLRDGQFTTFTSREGLSNDYVYVSFQDRAGTLWAGTTAGLNRMRGGAWGPEPACAGGPVYAVRSIAEDDTGALWVGTYGGGVCVRRGGRWTRLAIHDGLAHDSVRAIVADGPAMWVGTVGGLSRFMDGRWTTYTTREGLPSNSIVCLRAADGALWVGTDGGGLARMKGGRSEVFTTREGLASDVVLALFRDRQGAMWVGTNGGLSVFRDGRFTTFTTRDGLVSDSVGQIVEDDQGNLWLGTSRGVSRIGRGALLAHDPGEGPLPVLTFDASDGMKSRQCTTPAEPPGLRSRDGRLWFATAKGLAVIDPRTAGASREPPPVVIESVLVDGQPLSLAGPLTVAPGARRVVIEYAGLSLAAPDRVRFRARLDGYDPDWVDSQDRRRASYTGLHPGTYRFRVAARQEGGEWGAAEASVAFRLAPHFYETASFRLLAALAAALAVVVFYRRRVRRLEARHRELAALVEERTRGLRAEKERAETLGREADLQRQRAEEASALKTELLAMAAHDLRNPLQAIAGFSEVLAASPGSDEDREMAVRIHEGAQRMIALIEDLLATAAIDAGDFSLAAVDVVLADLVRVVVDTVAPLAESKGQRIEVETDDGTVVRGDPRRLAQVVENLLTNALKFSPAASRVTVRVVARPEVVRVEVRDEGPGLRAEDFPRLFGRFVRLSARPTGGEPSTGLGLSIVKQLVELHGGRVGAESDASGGSTFFFELPRRAAA